MKNYVKPGEVLTLVAPYNVASGAGLLVGSIFAIASASAASGGTVEGVTVGVFDLLAEGAGSGQAFAIGEAVYWDDTAKRVTKTSTNNTKIGVAVAAKATADVVARVRLNGTF